MDGTDQLQRAGTGDAAPSGADGGRPEPFDFAATVDRFETPLLRYVGHLIGPGRHETEDVVQETFLRLHRTVGRGGPDSIRNLPVWLYRVAHNLAMDAGRRISRDRKGRERMQRAAVEERKAAPDAEIIGAVIRREVCERAMAELKALPEDLRQVVLLKVIQGMTMAQIAAVMDISASNVCYRLGRALRTISVRLKEAGLI